MENLMKLAMKTSTYGIMHMVIAIMVAYAISGDIRVALAIGLIEPAVQTFAFLLHEHVWSRVS